MRAQDRIASNSKQHWVLDALVTYEDEHEGGVTETALDEHSDVMFPGVEWVHETLMELLRRNLVDIRDGEFYSTSVGRVALKNHDPPREKPWTDATSQPATVDGGESDGDETLDDESDGEDGDGGESDGGDFPDTPWVPSDHDDVYFGTYNDAIPLSDDNSASHVGVDTAVKLRDRLPDGFMVVITTGPDRDHDVAHVIDVDGKRVRLDFHAEHPNESTWQDALIEDVHATIDERQTMGGIL